MCAAKDDGLCICVQPDGLPALPYADDTVGQPRKVEPRKRCKRRGKRT